MGERFKDSYRIPSARLRNWDYGWNAPYFVTICTAHRECYFGEIVDGEMILFEIGKIVEQYWNEIPHHFSFVKLGEFIVMPNHVHGIIIIDKPNNDESHDVETPNLGVSTKTAAASEKWNPGTLGVIINQYKRICTLNARKIHSGFEWQSRFYDHIIRNDESFQRISEYIQNNPLNWHIDKFHNKSGQT